MLYALFRVPLLAYDGIGSVAVTKLVEDDVDQTYSIRDYGFTVTLAPPKGGNIPEPIVVTATDADGKSIEIPVTWETEKDADTGDGTGAMIGTFTLKHKQTVTINDLPIGTTCN